MAQETIANLLMITSAVLWSLAYLLIIRRSYKDKAYGMPIVACTANIAWEFHYTIVKPFPPPQLYANMVWLLIDIVILFQVFAYSRSEYPKCPSIILQFLIGAALMISYLVIHFSEASNIVPVTTAFAQNFMMSALFIGLLIRRADMSGQTIYIGILKAIGTLLIAVLIYFVYEIHRDLSIMTFLYIGILLLDIAYIVLLFFQIRRQGYSPWRRW